MVTFVINSKKSPRPYNTAQLITKSFQLITKFHENCAQFWPIFMLESLIVASGCNVVATLATFIVASECNVVATLATLIVASECNVVATLVTLTVASECNVVVTLATLIMMRQKVSLISLKLGTAVVHSKLIFLYFQIFAKQNRICLRGASYPQGATNSEVMPTRGDLPAMVD